LNNIAAILLALACFMPAQAQPTLYVLGWSSPLPAQIERVAVTGGALVQVLTVNDGLSGTIAASAERACVTITAEGHTTSGILVRFARSWDAGCDRLWLPFMQKAPSGEARG
jgi:hypothetical protein